MGRILITGGSGLIGSALTQVLSAKGHEVIILSREPAKAKDLPKNARALGWDARTADGWGKQVDGALAVINLAGATLSRPPWTARHKRRIRESRTNAGRAVVEAIRNARQRPSVLVQASGIGYYGLHDDDLVTEQTPPGADFLAEVCKDWEASTAEVDALGVRRVVVRTGLVLSKNGGVLPVIALPFRFFVGGPLGSGRQYYPWIHMADEIGAIVFLMDRADLRGAFNLSAPRPVTNREFSRALARSLHRPSLIPVPALPMKLALGEMAELLVLGGQRALPEALLEAGYHFAFEELEPALHDVWQ